jgi:hypothetical protein
MSDEAIIVGRMRESSMLGRSAGFFRNYGHVSQGVA